MTKFEKALREVYESLPKCGQALYHEGRRVATCTQVKGEEHSHDDHTVIDLIALRLAKPVKSLRCRVCRQKYLDEHKMGCSLVHPTGTNYDVDYPEVAVVDCLEQERKERQ